MLNSSASTMFSDLEVEITPDAPIGPMTWYGIGGHADILVMESAKMSKFYYLAIVYRLNWSAVGRIFL